MSARSPRPGLEDQRLHHLAFAEPQRVGDGSGSLGGRGSEGPPFPGNSKLFQVPVRRQRAIAHADLRTICPPTCFPSQRTTNRGNSRGTSGTSRGKKPGLITTLPRSAPR